MLYDSLRSARLRIAAVLFVGQRETVAEQTVEVVSGERNLVERGLDVLYDERVAGIKHKHGIDLQLIPKARADRKLGGERSYTVKELLVLQRNAVADIAGFLFRPGLALLGKLKNRNDHQFTPM